ncbi:MAG: hypothetical protein N2320_05305, partial [Candidatus Bipolaricaulota bacterium]|nr:hypothetical protein [Candidatus Bipolaricaulota bacterium]
MRNRWFHLGVLLLALGALGTAQAVDLQGPTEMGRCYLPMFTVTFTAGAQTASAIAFTVTRPNAGFSYVVSTGAFILPDGTIVEAEPTSSSGLNVIWNVDLILGFSYELPPGETITLEFGLLTGCGTISGTLDARVDWVETVPRYLTDSQPVQILPGAVLIYKVPTVVQAAVGDVITWTLI